MIGKDDGPGFVLARTDPDGRLYPVGISLQRWIADFFEINLQAIEAEKQAALGKLIAANQPKENEG